MSTKQDHPDIEKLPLDIEGVPVREAIRTIFRNPENGTPDNISKAGCLALALESNQGWGPGRGAVIWNEWRTHFPVQATLRNIANFEGKEFVDPVNFAGFDFGYAANFRLTIFRHRVFFDCAKFGNSTDFSYSYWAREASFNFSMGGADIKFQHCYWKEYVNFQGSQWESGSFVGSTACQGIGLSGGSWANSISFAECSFLQQFDASGQTWKSLKNRFYHSKYWLDKVMAHAEEAGCNPHEFEVIDCSGAQFLGRVDFSNRKFNQSTYFGFSENHNSFSSIKRDESGLPVLDEKGHPQNVGDNTWRYFTCFKMPPIFHGCELHQDTSFEDAKFPRATGLEEAARAYRTLKLAFSKQEAIREEQLFYRLEIREEAVGHLKNCWFAFRECDVRVACLEAMKSIFHLLYWTLADYGFSIFRPLTLLVLSVFLFSSAYGSSQGAVTCIAWTDACVFQSDWLRISILQSLPLSGLEKLEPTHNLSLCYSIALVAHKAVSLLAIFLIGLALRNLFKLK